jgi:16S rRNA (cytosine1402-N4)-methyltransferase
MNYNHEPVLLETALQFLEPQPGQNFIDATLGGGGYSRALLDYVIPEGKVLSIDLDPAALENYQAQLSSKQKKNAIAVHGNFRNLDDIVRNHEFYNIAGIVADIGLSSYQLDQSGRGITFQNKEPLDMRFDVSDPTTDARFIINNHSEEQLKEIFRNYGEDRLSGKIARAIVQRRGEKPFHYTTDLTELIRESLPKPQQHKWQDTARRIFQALRIAVNHELENLETFLPKALDLLNPGGKLVIISFHSLEDRIVKKFFVESSRGCTCPIDFPICRCGKNPLGMILTKKIVTANEEEQARNPRSIPAKLRAFKKL